MEHYAALAARLKAEVGMPLVLNGPPGAGLAHESGIAGLIDATRRAAAVVGVDSGPLHLAAVLGKSGVAIFGPTDPERNGPYGGRMPVLRTEGTETTYKRNGEIAGSMRAISPDAVFECLKAQL
jgi:heptosyltransferase-1